MQKSNYFDGYYFKHQKGNKTLCLIVGQSCSEDRYERTEEKFIQVITGDFSKRFTFAGDFPRGNRFSKKGISLNIRTPEFSLTGNIRYRDLSPLRYDIMGPFALFPMECRHGVISMGHRLEGKVRLNGETIDFTGGTGYMEKDSGRSFPSSYVWVQANDFTEDCSIMAAVAKIPFCGLHFRGCICAIQYGGREYRLATYLGVRVLSCTRKRIILKQGKYLLEIRLKESGGHLLKAPCNGKMARRVLESASCPAEFIFYRKGQKVFHLASRGAGFEYEAGNEKTRQSRLDK